MDITPLTFVGATLIICPMDIILEHPPSIFRRNPLKAAIYVRVSTADQRVESQLYDLRELAEQRGIEVVQTYQDCGISGSRARRPGLDALMADARKKKFSAVLVTAFDRVARSVKHFLQTIDELESLGVVFISRREQVDTSGMMGRLFLTLIASIAELESDLIRERVRAGMRRARMEGRRIGRARLDIDREQVVIDRRTGMSLTTVAKRHNISRASVCRLMNEANNDSPVAIPISSDKARLEVRV
jgi:DNA invertase Pin-like site-specific DNA recombinase